MIIMKTKIKHYLEEKLSAFYNKIMKPGESENVIWDIMHGISDNVTGLQENLRMYQLDILLIDQETLHYWA